MYFSMYQFCTCATHLILIETICIKWLSVCDPYSLQQNLSNILEIGIYFQTNKNHDENFQIKMDLQVVV